MRNPRMWPMFLAALVLGTGTALLQAADFWQTKKFSEWDPKEVQKMLRDSPWARPVEVHLQGPPVNVGGGRGRRGGGGGMPSMSAESGGGAWDSQGGGAPRGAGSMESMSGPPSVSVIVRWHSALPIKQAVARARFGDEAASSPEAAKMLGRQEERYIVGVIGLPMQAARGQVKPDASLVVKGKPPISLADAQGDRDQRGVNLYLFFPKQALTVEDGDIELRLKLGRVELKRKFRLKDMVFDGKLEI